MKAASPYLPTEHQEQVALIDWAELVSISKWPALRWMYAVPNGGVRHFITAVNIKAEGVRPGVPDLVLPFPVFPFHGAYLEMKRRGGSLTPLQVEWRDYLKSQGYAYCMAQGFDEARDFLINYLERRLGLDRN